MKQAAITHVETITQYFVAGEEVELTPEQKLLAVIFNSGEVETKVTTFRNVLEVVKYKTKKELESAFWRVAAEFAEYLHPNELIIETI